MKKFMSVVSLLVSVIVLLISCTIRIEIVDPDNDITDNSFTPIEEVEEKRIATDDSDSTNTTTSSTGVSPDEVSEE